MDYLFFYWIFSSLFAYNYLLDKDNAPLGHHIFMSVLGIGFGWIIFPVVLGDAIDKINNP